MSKVSVIIPVYKVEKYLSDCIISIVNQTYTDLEILLIDDGSPDQCGKICDEWAQKDSRIRVIHTENHGLSSARNLGVANASGEYVVFVDSDDWLSPEYVEKLHEQMVGNSADLVMCGSRSEWQDNSKPAAHLPTEKKVLTAAEFSHSFLVYLGAYSVVWNKMYRRELLNSVEFVKGKYFEDTYFIGEILQKVDKIAFIPDELYHYRMRKSSIINKDRLELCEYMQGAVRHLVQLYQEDAYSCYLAEKLLYTQMLIYYVDSPQEKKMQWKKELSKQRKKLWRSSFVNMKFRMKMVITALFPIMYCKNAGKKKGKSSQYFE